MNLLDILAVDCIKAPLVSTDKKGVIDELVDTLAAAEKVQSQGELKAAVWEREQTRTTGIGHGLAIPHGKCACVRELVIAIGKPAAPIDFASIDGKPVRLVVLLVSPLDKTSDHIQALAGLSRLMTNGDVREQIYNANGAQELYGLFEAQLAGAAPS